MTGADPGGITAMSGDPGEALARLNEWAGGFAAKAEKYEAVARQTEELRLSATSASGAVRVTVRADGSVTDLEFTPKARTIPLPELASLILATMREAQSGIATRVGEVMAGQLGDDDPQTRELMLAELRGRFPAPDEEPDDHEPPEDQDGENSPW
ncbi:Nucleoid-associated protein YbaB [Amycolatopsis sp. YIM 10]|nr:Nucleoid-associated protein YbaB [Amycolatopsis sp. YIM 10]